MYPNFHITPSPCQNIWFVAFLTKNSDILLLFLFAITEMLLKIFIIADLETSTFLRGPKSLNHDPHKNVFFTINNPHYNFLLCLNPFYYDLDLKKLKLCNLFVILAISGWVVEVHITKSLIKSLIILLCSKIC